MSDIVVTTDIRVGKNQFQFLGFEIRETILADRNSYSLITYFMDDCVIEEKREERFSSFNEAYRRYTQYLGSFKPIEGIKRLRNYRDESGHVWVSNIIDTEEDD